MTDSPASAQPEPQPAAPGAQPGAAPGAAPAGERPGKYQRDFPGLLGAMLILLLVIAGFVAFRGFVRDNQPTPVEPINYLEAVEGAFARDDVVAYPPSLPQDWVATSVVFTPSDPPAFSLGVLSDTGSFVGLRQVDDSDQGLAEEFLDEDAQRGEPVTLDSPLGSTWETWSDQGGDHGFSIDLEDLGTVLVYGSADVDVLRAYAESLVTAPPA